jgi:hypothetical protein
VQQGHRITRTREEGEKAIAKGQFLLVAVACALIGAPAAKAHSDVIVNAQEIKWGPAPPSIPSGAQAAVLHGDPGKEGLFSLRLKLPKGYALPPHTHPKPEIVTVISGTFRLGPSCPNPRAAHQCFVNSPLSPDVQQGC